MTLYKIKVESVIEDITNKGKIFQCGVVLMDGEIEVLRTSVLINTSDSATNIQKDVEKQLKNEIKAFRKSEDDKTVAGNLIDGYEFNEAV